MPVCSYGFLYVTYDGLKMDNYETVTREQYARLMSVLLRNKNKTFVKRILEPNKFPRLPQKDGSVATHKMADSEVNGKYIVYPTVLYDGEKLIDYGDSAINHVLESGNYIEFPSAESASFFAKRYKGAWGGIMNNEPR